MLYENKIPVAGKVYSKQSSDCTVRSWKYIKLLKVLKFQMVNSLRSYLVQNVFLGRRVWNVIIPDHSTQGQVHSLKLLFFMLSQCNLLQILSQASWVHTANAAY